MWNRILNWLSGKHPAELRPRGGIEVGSVEGAYTGGFPTAASAEEVRESIERLSAQQG